MVTTEEKQALWAPQAKAKVSIQRIISGFLVVLGVNGLLVGLVGLIF